MKEVIQLMLLTLLPYFVFAQIKNVDNTKVEVGKPYAVIDALEKHYIEFDDRLYTFKKLREKLVVQKFDIQNLEMETIRTYTDFPRHFVIEHIGIYFDKCLLFYSLWDKKNGKEQLFYRELEMETGQFIKDAKFLFDVKDRVSGIHASSGTFFGTEVVSKFKFESSYDGKNLLIRYRKIPKIKNDDINYDIIGLYVYDIWMNKLWYKEVKMPYTESKVDNLDYYVNDNAEVIILTRVFNDNSHEMKIQRGKSNYKIELLKVKKNSPMFSKTEISLGAKLINSIKLHQIKYDKLVLCGYYSKENPENADGLFVLHLDEKGNVLNNMSYEFPMSFINQNVTKKAVKHNKRLEKKDEVEFLQLDLRKIIISNDGGITIIGEQYYTQEDYSGRFIYTIYYYRDIVISRVDPTGKLLWNKKLPKFQVGNGTGKNDMSFTHFIIDDNHIFLFLDNIKNKELKADEFPKIYSSGSGGWLTEYIVNDKNGDITKSYILNTREVKNLRIYQFTTSRISRISKKSIVFEAYKKQKEDVLIKVEFE